MGNVARAGANQGAVSGSRDRFRQITGRAGESRDNDPGVGTLTLSTSSHERQYRNLTI